MFSKLVLLFIALCVAMPVYSEVLTLDKTMQLALDHQPQLAAQQGLIDARRASITADQQLPDPKLKFGVSNVPLDTLSLTKDAMTQTSVSVEQRFPGGNKRALRGQLATLNSEQSLADFDNNRREIRRAAGLAWLDVYLAEQSLRLLHEQQAAFQQQIAAANIAYRNAQATQDAVLSLQNGLTQLMDDELAKQAQINTARARLARWIGNVAQADMPKTMPNLPAILSLNQLLKGLINHPQIRKYELTIALAQTEMDLAQADKIPDWTVELGYAKRGSAYPDMIAAQVSVDLPVFPKNRQDKNISGKQMMLESARYQREDALRNLTAELTGYYSDWEISQRRINLLANSALPVAQQRMAAVLISYQNNQSSMTNVIEAHHAELNLRLQLLEQNIAHERAQLQIAYYAGE